MRALWTPDDVSVTERIRAFGNEFPTSVMGGSGTRMTLYLRLMGLDVEPYPPFRITTFDNAYERTGYDPRPQNADEATLYEHALGFVDRFIRRPGRGECLSATGLTPNPSSG